MRPTLLIAAGVLCLGLSCAAPAGSPGQPETGDMEVFIGNVPVLTPDSPTTITAGGEFAVTLEENPSTGYSWSYTVKPAGLVEETAKESFDTAPEPMVGAPVNTIWKFKSVGEGEATLTFLYYRPWEKPETAVSTKVFTVRIAR